MKIYVSSILFYLLLVQIFSLPIVNFFWAQNQTFISQNLCENLDKPLMNCKGKCQLNIQFKKIVADNTANKNHQSILKIVGIELYIITEPINFLQKNFIPTIDKQIGCFTNFYRFHFLHSEIKPPSKFIC
jgi:hypothetical protein